MHVVLRQPEGDRELAVSLRNPEATLHDVLHPVLGDGVPSAIAIDDRVVDCSAKAIDAGLHEGAVLAPERVGAARRPAPLELVVLTGLDAGRTFPIGAGRWSIGRDPDNQIAIDDETLSRHHCGLELDGRGTGTIIDFKSANGTYVDGVEISAEEPAELEPGIGDPDRRGGAGRARGREDDRPLGLDLRRHIGPSGAVAFNRPPRMSGVAPPAALEVPAEPGEPPPAHFSIASTRRAAGPRGRHGGAHERHPLRAVLPAQPVHRRRHVVGVQAPLHQAEGAATSASTTRRSASSTGRRARRAGSSASGAGSARRTPPRSCAARRCRACGCGSGGTGTTTS